MKVKMSVVIMGVMVVEVPDDHSEDRGRLSPGHDD